MWTKNLWILSALSISVIGLLWNSRYLHSQSQQGEDLDAYLEAGAPPLPRRDLTDFWERENSSCFHLDNVCGHDGRWFYAPSQWPKAAHQPTIKLLVEYDDIATSHGFNLEIEQGIYLNVSSTSHQHYDDTICSFSPTPYHLVVQSAYSEMMGEFYSRAILGLNRWMRDYPIRSNDDIQMYMHSVDSRKQTLFEGHQLFLGGLPNNNKFDSFLSLMPRNDSSCRCYEKLIFCGYSSVLSDNSTSVDPDGNMTVFKPRSSISNPTTECAAWTDPKYLKNGNCAAYRKLRRDLIKTYSDKDPTLDRKIRQYQRNILIQKGLISNSTSNVEGWKFIGLAHRKSRRRWLNIEQVIAMCDRKFTAYKIVCLTIDVEEADSPEQQLLMHRSLHAFIGVHGAQLTQGVLLPKHGFVLELLPWVPFYLWGVWVATMHQPTPLGIIFHKTDLNHVGYPLSRDSVPLCLHVDPSDEELTRDCLMNETSGVIKKFRWAGRDFNVPLKVIKDFISTFLLKESNSICDDMRTRAEKKNFVLYNAFCHNMNEKRYHAEHYFREKDGSKPKNVHEIVRRAVNESDQDA
ncbi:hypothetical protein ACHAXR_012990 [Thalassiosira sp. AJA248-18]